MKENMSWFSNKRSPGHFWLSQRGCPFDPPSAECHGFARGTPFEADKFLINSWENSLL